MLANSHLRSGLDRSQGALTLQDVDPTAGEALVEFRDWAVEQFGSVCS